ncbi:efflux RND transporter periplasmic adaptor subunit [bacterium]|nr:efflux RND transporter periplasmic adaptor subunit [bacterium]
MPLWVFRQAPFIGLTLLGISLSGCKPKPVVGPPPKPPEVFVSTPLVRTVTDFEEYTGRMAPVKIVDLRARVSGYLEEVQFTDGADVAANAPLFRIDARPFVAALAEAEANVLQAEARLERASRQEERLTVLAEKKITTTEDFEQSKFDRLEADGVLKGMLAARDIAKLNLEFTEIKAPFAGRISRRLVDPGNLVMADTTPLATIVSLDPVYAYFDVDERTVLQVRRLIAEGKMTSARDQAIEVELALADEADYSLTGRVNFVDNQISATTGTLRLRAEVENPRKLLAPGMFVRVKVPIGVPRQAVLVPEEALGSDQGQRFVYVVDADNKVEYRRIKAGRLNEGMRVVNDGLASHDRVVVNGLQRVRPGITVTPQAQPEEKKEAVEQAAAESAPSVLVETPTPQVGRATPTDPTR